MSRNIKKIVYRILEKDKLAREDDWYLIQQTLMEMLPCNQGTAFGQVLQGMKVNGISFEAITKAKQNFLDTYPELYGDEIWKDIKGFEGIYQVSNYGRIKSIIRYKRIMKTALNRGGYLQICLTDSKHKKHTIRVHRLVADNFLENKEEKQQVNHIDGNKLNNRVSNLEWCTRSENIRHAFENDLIYRGKGRESHRARAVNQYSKKGDFIRKWDCISDASRYLKLNKNNISTCCRGKRKTVHGFIWKYAEE